MPPSNVRPSGSFLRHDAANHTDSDMGRKVEGTKFGKASVSNDRQEESNSYKLVLRQLRASMSLLLGPSIGTHVNGSRFIFMSSGQQRKIYQSANGDSWWLCREQAGVFVLHEANQPSGGTVTKASAAGNDWRINALPLLGAPT
jgi:hypothetical protein